MASALRELGYNVSYVGNEQDGAPPRGSSDQTIIDHARTTNQVVVTSNHDMILLCLEQPQRSAPSYVSANPLPKASPVR